MKQNIIKQIFMFAIGAGVGSVVTYKILKKRNDEEIQSVIESFSKRQDPEEVSDTTEDEDNPEEKELEEAENVINQNGYADVSEKEKEEVLGVETNKDPYVIEPAELGECDYPVVTLEYFTDGVVADEEGNIVGNSDELIGEDFAAHFGDYEEDPDSVYVRNNNLKVDYEILKEYRSYPEKYMNE